MPHRSMLSSTERESLIALPDTKEDLIRHYAFSETDLSIIDQAAMILPRVKITELLLEVNEWTGFTRYFTHLKTGDQAEDKHVLPTITLLTVIKHLLGGFCCPLWARSSPWVLPPRPFFNTGGASIIL